MQKKSKTILTAVVTALFVLSVSYFALLAPTTAWYYQTEDIHNSFKFGFFDVEQTDQTPEEFETTESVNLRGATRFADLGESLFDEMIHVVKVEVENTGKLGARVVTDVTVNSCTTTVNGEAGEPDTSASARNGLRWFICGNMSTDAEPSSYKTEINSMLTAKDSTWPKNYNTFASDAAYETYNTSAVAALETHNTQNGVAVNVGQTKNIYIVFWAEYGELQNTFQVSADETRDIVSLDYDVTVNVVAKPDTKQSSTLTISNTASTDKSVTLSLMETSGWGAGTAITVAASDSASRTLDAGTQYKLTVASNAGVHFEVNNEDVGTQIIGTVSNAGDTISIVPNA